MKQGKENHGTEMREKVMQSKNKYNEWRDTKNPPKFIDYRMMFIYC